MPQLRPFLRPIRHLSTPLRPTLRHLLPRPTPHSTNPRHASVLSRLSTKTFWVYLSTQYRSAMKLALALNVAVITTQLSVHAYLHDLEETARPTTSDWGIMPRYYLRRARIPNPWNPWGDPKPDIATKLYLDRCLDEVKGGALIMDQKSESWKRDYFRLRKERAEWFERNGRWEEAREEYTVALAVELRTAKRERVDASARLAKILEWEGKEEEAFTVLRRAVGWAGGRGEGPMPALPEVGSRENTGVLLDAVSEYAGYLARKGQYEPALGLFTEVLRRRRGAVMMEDPQNWNEEIADPCRDAATMVAVGELMFAMGKQKEGVAWSEKAFAQAWGLLHFRQACKDCAGVAAENLQAMGRLLKKQAEERKPGKLEWNAEKEKKKLLTEAERLEKGYRDAKMDVDAVRAVRDSEEVWQAARLLKD